MSHTLPDSYYVASRVNGEAVRLVDERTYEQAVTALIEARALLSMLRKEEYKLPYTGCYSNTVRERMEEVDRLAHEVTANYPVLLSETTETF
jgi:hypothetical protein